jgi:hypothetical protein
MMIVRTYITVGEIYALLRYYAASSRNLLPTFRDNLPVPSSAEVRSCCPTERHEGVWMRVSGDVAAIVLNLDTRWGSAVSFVHSRLYLAERVPDTQ